MSRSAGYPRHKGEECGIGGSRPAGLLRLRGLITVKKVTTYLVQRSQSMWPVTGTSATQRPVSHWHGATVRRYWHRNLLGGPTRASADGLHQHAAERHQ